MVRCQRCCRLGPADQAVEDKGDGCEDQQHQEGSAVAAGSFQNFAGYGGDQRTTHDSKGHEGQICRIILHSKEGGSEGSCDGWAGAVRETGEAQTNNTEG